MGLPRPAGIASSDPAELSATPFDPNDPELNAMLAQQARDRAAMSHPSTLGTPAADNVGAQINAQLTGKPATRPGQLPAPAAFDIEAPPVNDNPDDITQPAPAAPAQTLAQKLADIGPTVTSERMVPTAAEK